MLLLLLLLSVMIFDVCFVSAIIVVAAVIVIEMVRGDVMCLLCSNVHITRIHCSDPFSNSVYFDCFCGVNA